ncbi:hypothetical protein L484_017141 [Morus notabilis]|uniref:Strictosidine synthase conserved region domain-containing protein n=1 Tax=Morus notabilis TaxID=981085 RepID=W9QL29_9ROSA|nr:hypothetical protein L484_017141 [Morus notabilis]
MIQKEKQGLCSSNLKCKTLFSKARFAGYPEFKAHKVEFLSRSLLPVERDVDNLLRKSEIRFQNELQGPQSIAFDLRGRGPYTGVADGRILYFNERTHLKVGPQDGLATPITRFTSDLDIDEYGNVYFTDSSTIYQRSYENIVKYSPVGKILKILEDKWGKYVKSVMGCLV